MAMKVKLRFDGSCPKHPRYSPERDGQPVKVKGYECAGCDDLYVIYLYAKVIAKKIQHNHSLTLENTGIIIPGYVDGHGAIKSQQVVTEKELDKTLKEVETAKTVPSPVKFKVPTVLTPAGEEIKTNVVKRKHNR